MFLILLNLKQTNQMNRMKLLCSLSLAFFVQAVSFAADNNCIISGKINGVPRDTKVMALRRSGEYGFDTVSIAKTKENGEFSLVLGSSSFNEMIEVRFEGLRSTISVISEMGNVVMSGDKNMLYKTDIKGTPENDRWNSFQKYSLEIVKQRNELMQRTSSMTKEEKIKLHKGLDDLQKHFSDSLISNFPNSAVALYLAKVPLPMMKYKQIDSTLAHFKPYFAKHRYYKEMKERADILRRVAPGAMAPDFNVLQPDGKSKISLSSLRGKYVLLDFWASWCVPCRAENKGTVELYAKYHPLGLEIVSFSLDSKLDAWSEAVEKDGLVWHNASDLVGGKLSPVATEYGIDGLPAIWLIDPSGRIVAESVRGEALDKILSSVLIKK
jgi:peroxiredoxin